VFGQEGLVREQLFPVVPNNFGFSTSTDFPHTYVYFSGNSDKVVSVPSRDGHSTARRIDPMSEVRQHALMQDSRN